MEATNGSGRNEHTKKEEEEEEKRDVNSLDVI